MNVRYLFPNSLVLITLDRAPEVLLGNHYNGAIDMWSLACVCSEMFLGLPLFPGVSQHNQLSRIVDMLGNPPSFLLDGKNGSKYFTVKPKTVSAPIDSLSNISRPNRDKPDINDNSKAQVTYRIKTAEEYAKETNTEVPKLRKYLRYDRLDEVIMKCPLANKDKLTQEQKNIEIMRRKCFLNFLQGLFNLNPFERWTAKQAASHPFITNAPFYGYFTTPEDLKAKERKIMFTAAMQRSQMAGGVNTSVKLNATNVQPFSDIPKTKADETATKEKEFVPLQQTGRRMTEPINTSKVVAEAAIEAATEAVLPALKRGEQVLPDYSSPVVQKTKRKPSGSGKSLAQSNEVPVPISSSMPLPMAMGPNNPSKPPDYYPTQHYVGNSYQNDPYRMSNSNIQYGSPGQATVWNGAYFVPVNQSTMMIQGQGIHPMTSPQGSFESLGGYINGIPQQVQHQSHSYGSQPMQQYYHLQGNSQFPYSGQPFYSQQQYLSQPPLDNSNYNQPYGYNQWGSLPGSESLSGSISAFGPVGSMQEGSSMSMTDFGYALARPDLNEYRKMNSQNVQHYSASHSLSNSLTYQIMKHGNSTRGSNAKSYDKNGLDHNYGRSEQRRTSFNQRNEGSRHRGREKSDKHVRHSMTEADRRNKSSHEGSYTASTNGSFSKSYEIGNYNNDEHFAGANRANVDSQASNLTDTTSPGSQIVMKMEEISMKDSEEDNTDSFVKDGARLRQRVSSGKLSEAGSANDDRNDGTEDAQADWDPFFPVDDIN